MTRSKKLLFTAIMLALPIVLLLALEGVLRLAGVFEREPLFRTVWHKGEQVRQINQHVARRYFDPAQVTVPGVAPERFAIEKSAKTFRILCLGGSTTAGFPFDGHVPFPQQLRFMLRQTDPQTHFEVLNLGISAVNSFTFVDLLPELLEMQPDAVLIYMGHNEFYGAFGSASRFGISGSDGLVRLYLKLQNWRIVQALQAGLAAMRSGNGSTAEKPISLMEAVVSDQAIALGSEQYERTLRAYNNNMTILLDAFREHKIPVVLSNLVSNIRDQVPFSRPRASTFVLASDRIASQLAPQQLADSLQSYHLRAGQGSSDALEHFQFGQYALLAGDTSGARQPLYLAKDKDQVRFRASEELNAEIKNLAEKHGAAFLDMQRVFAAASPAGLIGAELMCDHLHPNPQGYFLMARAFYQKMLQAGLVKQSNTHFAPGSTPFFVTDLDWDIGLLKIFEMVHRWPFPEKPVTFADYPPYGDPYAAEVAHHYLFEENIWSRAQYKMAEEWQRRGQPERARKHYHAVSVFVPDDPYPYHQIAATYQNEENWPAREFFLKLELAFADNKGMVQYQIAMSQYKQGKLRDAVQTMLSALNFPDLDNKEKLNARYYLAGFYFEARQLIEAARVLQTILNEAPDFAPAKSFLAQIQSAMQQNQ